MDEKEKERLYSENTQEEAYLWMLENDCSPSGILLDNKGIEVILRLIHKLQTERVKCFQEIERLGGTVHDTPIGVEFPAT